jgi:hypothetical protein
MDIQKAVENRLKEMERNTLWLVRKSGVSKTSLYTFMQRKTELTWSNLDDVAIKGLGIKLSTLIKEAESYE